VGDSRPLGPDKPLLAHVGKLVAYNRHCMILGY
jgi:hypothetical protein